MTKSLEASLFHILSAQEIGKTDGGVVAVKIFEQFGTYGHTMSIVEGDDWPGRRKRREAF